MLTQTEVRELFDYRDGQLYWRMRRGRRGIPGTRAGSCDSYNGYWRIMICKRSYPEHRLIWLWHFGELPQMLDHIDGNRANNRIQNLRPVNHEQNMHNSRGRASRVSRYKGVSWDAKRRQWRASIRANRQTKNLGCFPEESDAAQAYNFAAAHHFGEFARLNETTQTWVGLEQGT